MRIEEFESGSGGKIIFQIEEACDSLEVEREENLSYLPEHDKYYCHHLKNIFPRSEEFVDCESCFETVREKKKSIL